MLTTLSNVQAKTKNITELNIVVNKPEWKEICKECSLMARRQGWKKTDSKKLLKEIREKNNFETN